MNENEGLNLSTEDFLNLGLTLSPSIEEPEERVSNSPDSKRVKLENDSIESFLSEQNDEAVVGAQPSDDTTAVKGEALHEGISTPPTPRVQQQQQQRPKDAYEFFLEGYMRQEADYQSVYHRQLANNDRLIKFLAKRDADAQRLHAIYAQRRDPPPPPPTVPNTKRALANWKAAQPAVFRLLVRQNCGKRYRCLTGNSLVPPESLEFASNLVPIRLDLEIEGAKIMDTFTWDANEDKITPEIFADVLVQDLSLAHISHLAVPQIAASIRHQLEMGRAPGAVGDTSNESDGPVWYIDVPEMALQEGCNNGDLRVVIWIDVTVGSINLLDRFEWDLYSTRNSPELFAQSVAADLGLGGDFITAISHQIREQTRNFLRALSQNGYHFDGSAVTDDELHDLFLPPLKSSYRINNTVNNFTPFLVELEPGVRDSLEIDYRNEIKQNNKKRHRRGRRNAANPYPSLDHLRTFRTPSGLNNYILPSFAGYQSLPPDLIPGGAFANGFGNATGSNINNVS